MSAEHHCKRFDPLPRHDWDPTLLTDMVGIQSIAKVSRFLYPRSESAGLEDHLTRHHEDPVTAIKGQQRPRPVTFGEERELGMREVLRLLAL